MERSAKPVSASRITMSKVMEPTDANFLGKVFGGSILSLIDLTAYASASKFAGQIAVTASFDRVDFHEPIEVGEIVVCEGFVSFVGRSSMEVTIEIHAENILLGTRRHTNTARVTMVAIQNGKPITVPLLLCENRQDKERFLEGKLRREMRSAQKADFENLLASFVNKSDAELEALIEQNFLLQPNI